MKHSTLLPFLFLGWGTGERYNHETDPKANVVHRERMREGHGDACHAQHVSRAREAVRMRRIRRGGEGSRAIHGGGCEERRV